MSREQPERREEEQVADTARRRIAREQPGVREHWKSRTTVNSSIVNNILYAIWYDILNIANNGAAE